jgi:hypothetical protein
VLAGGGRKPGPVLGRTDKRGRVVADRPLTAPDFMATIYAALGINYKKEYTTAGGRPIRIVDKPGKPIAELLA